MRRKKILPERKHCSNLHCPKEKTIGKKDCAVRKRGFTLPAKERLSEKERRNKKTPP